MRGAGRPAGLVHATEFEPLQGDEPANEVHFRLWPGASLCCTSPRFEYDWSAKFYGTPVTRDALLQDLVELNRVLERGTFFVNLGFVLTLIFVPVGIVILTVGGIIAPEGSGVGPTPTVYASLFLFGGVGMAGIAAMRWFGASWKKNTLARVAHFVEHQIAPRYRLFGIHVYTRERPPMRVGRTSCIANGFVVVYRVPSREELARTEAHLFHVPTDHRPAVASAVGASAPGVPGSAERGGAGAVPATAAAQASQASVVRS